MHVSSYLFAFHAEYVIRIDQSAISTRIQIERKYFTQTNSRLTHASTYVHRSLGVDGSRDYQTS